MDFQLGSEQQQLSDSLSRLIERNFDFRTRKASIEQDWTPKMWSQLAEIGLLGLPFAESNGGFGWSAADMSGVMETLGVALMVEPYISTIGLAGRLLAKAGHSPHKALIPQMIAGTLRVVVAHSEEETRYDLQPKAMIATREGDRWALSGKKTGVLHAPCAEKMIVSAANDDGGGTMLFLIDANAPDVVMRRYRTFDDMPAADIVLENLTVGDEALIGGAGDGLDLIEEAVDFSTALLASEAVGLIHYATDQTIEYLKTRRQFGVTLGSFQALQHRAVDMMISLEQARSIALLACFAVDGEIDPVRRSRAVSAAKIKIADTCRQIRHESVQLHGAIGMTDDLKLSHAFRRLTAIGQLFGDAGYHLDRFARLDDRVAN